MLALSTAAYQSFFGALVFDCMTLAAAVDEYLSDWPNSLLKRFIETPSSS